MGSLFHRPTLSIARELLVVMVLCAPLSWGVSARADDGPVDDLMFLDPELDIPGTKVTWQRELVPLWIAALQNPERDLHRQAAYSIRVARGRGMPGLEATIDPLRRVLDVPRQAPAVRIAAAEALVALDARQVAPQLFARAQADGLLMRQVVEPALARWDFRPIRAVWLERLTLPDVRRSERVLAIRGLGTVAEAEAEPHLRALVIDPRAPAGVRLAAAQSLATLADESIAELAGELASRNGPDDTTHRLMAVTLLQKQDSPRIRALLLELAVDSEPAVAAMALERLLERDPVAIPPVLDQVLASRDAKVRLHGVNALLHLPSESSVGSLINMLDDPHPDVRRQARRHLHQFAMTDELAPLVREETTKVLAADEWRGQEQAALLLGQLDHDPAAGSMVELLESQRPEVMIAAAWALRELNVAETFEPMLALAEREVARVQSKGTLSPADEARLPGVDGQVSQLFQAFGRAGYSAAEPVLRTCVPKHSFGVQSRGAAIWALGKLYEDQPQADLVAQLSERLADEDPYDPEQDLVKRQSAVSLGRMNAPGALPLLERYSTNTFEISAACRWSIGRITGETPPRQPDIEIDGLAGLELFIRPLRAGSDAAEPAAPTE